MRRWKHWARHASCPLCLDGCDLGLHLLVARGFLARLLGWHALPVGGGWVGLWLDRCSAVHGAGLREPLRVWFIGKDGSVLEGTLLKPGRFAIGPRGTRAVLEARTDAEVLDAISVGRQITLGANRGGVR